MTGTMKLSAMILLLGTSVLSCRTTQEDHKIASLEEDNMPPAIETIEQWNQLEADVKAAILDSEYSRYKTLSVSPWKTLTDLSEESQRGLAEKMQTFMGSNGATEVTDETYSKVGKIQARVRFLSIGNSIIGGHIEYSQEGCEMPDETVSSFNSKAEAEGSGCELLGSSWRSHGLFNYNGAPLEYSDFMEWSH